MTKAKLTKMLNQAYSDAGMVEDYIVRTNNDMLIEIYLGALFYLASKIEFIEAELLIRR
jgi:hypothetical protein